VSESINGRKKKNLDEKFLINLKELEHNCPPIKCGLNQALPSKSTLLKGGREENDFTVEKSENH
jgi:hypothetical protein